MFMPKGSLMAIFCSLFIPNPSPVTSPKSFNSARMPRQATVNPCGPVDNMPILRPAPDINYRIQVMQPDPGIDYKIQIIDPDRSCRRFPR